MVSPDTTAPPVPAGGRRVVILYFARLREDVGVERERLELPPDVATVVALRAFLRRRGGAWAVALAPERSVRVAVDQTMVTGDRDLADGAEVAFFPPVTGG